MRKAVLPIAGILLLSVGVAIGWFSARHGMPEPEQKGTPHKLDDEPALEEVEEAEDALRLGGFDRAFVYRWRGAALDGYVLLDTQRGTERVALGPVPKDGAKPDPSFRGLLVIAIRPKAAGIPGHECIWAVTTRVTTKEGLIQGLGAPSSGRLPDLSGSGSYSGGGRFAFYKLGLPGGEERELFKLQLVKRD